MVREGERRLLSGAAVSYDAAIRAVTARGELIRKARQQKRELDAVQLEVVPHVDVLKKLVFLRVGARVMTYGVEDGAAHYLADRSLPIPGIDPKARPITDAVLHAFASASGMIEPTLDWDYRGSLVGGRPKPGMPADELATLQALMRLDVKGTGIVTATRSQVLAAMQEV